MRPRPPRPATSLACAGRLSCVVLLVRYPDRAALVAWTAVAGLFLAGVLAQRRWTRQAAAMGPALADAYRERPLTPGQIGQAEAVLGAAAAVGRGLRERLWWPWGVVVALCGLASLLGMLARGRWAAAGAAGLAEAWLWVNLLICQGQGDAAPDALRRLRSIRLGYSPPPVPRSIDRPA